VGFSVSFKVERLRQGGSGEGAGDIHAIIGFVHQAILPLSVIGGHQFPLCRQSISVENAVARRADGWSFSRRR
jgi:hypothetical protein